MIESKKEFIDSEVYVWHKTLTDINKGKGDMRRSVAAGTVEASVILARATMERKTGSDSRAVYPKAYLQSR